MKLAGLMKRARVVRSAQRPRSAGFTLLELVVVVAILSVLAGAALPVASKAWNSAARRATRTRLDTLALAALEFCRDTGRAPASAVELCEPPRGLAGWIGPYLALESVELRDGEPAVLDAWSRPVAVRAEPAFAFASLGADGVASEDDLVVGVDFTPLRREVTFAELAEAQRAIDAWCAARPGEPLPREWRAASRELVRAGLLADDPALEQDAWGATYVADPRTRGGLTRLTSRTLLERAGAPR